jgi:hypothetical protein
MPTIIGLIFFCAGAYCFFRKEDGLFGLLIVSMVFQASSAIDIAGRGIQPYYLISAFIMARAIFNRAIGLTSNEVLPQRKWLLIFGVIAIGSAVVLPFVFAGIPVMDPKVGIDEGVSFRPPLNFGLNNLAQAGFLAWHIVTAYAISGLDFSAEKTRSAYVRAFYFAVFFVFAQSICQLSGISFPDWLIRNNPGYGISDPLFMSNGIRSPGSFSEPSFAGACMAMFCTSFAAEYLCGKGNAIRMLISFAAIGTIASSGSLLALCLCLGTLLFWYSPFRYPWYINIKRAKRFAWVFFILAAPVIAALAISSNYRSILIANTISKGDTGSFFNRTASDIFGLQLLIRTYGIGVGFGSNRASSLVSSLLSNVGVVGVLAFVMFCFGLFTRLPKEYVWVKWAAFALLLNMCIDIPDVTFPPLWIIILIAISLSKSKVSVHQGINNSGLAFAGIGSTSLQ